MIIFLFITLVHVQAQIFINEHVTINPTTARSKDTKLTFYADVLEDVDVGASLWLTFPADISKVQTNLNTQCTISAPQTASATCQFSKLSDERILYKFEGINVKLQAYSNFQVEIFGFNNPTSTTATGSFEVELRNSLDLSLIKVSQDIILEATAADLDDNIILSSSSDEVGATGQSLRVQMTLKHPLEYGEFISISFPYLDFWAHTIPMLKSGLNSLVTPKSSNLPTSLPVDWVESSQTLNIRINGQVGAEEIIFEVSEIQNPFTTEKISGFIIQTKTSDLKGIINTSHANDVKMQVYKPLPVPLNLVALNLKNYTVQAYSEYEIIVRIPIAIQAGCKVLVEFLDQYYSFDQQFVQLQSSGAIGTGDVQYSLTYYKDPPTTVFETKSGCKNNVKENIPFILRFRQLKNNKYEIKVPSIVLKVFDIKGNIIAKVSEGLEANIQAGGLIMNKLISDSTNYVYDNVTLSFGLIPEHDITKNSKIVIRLPEEPYSFGLPQNCDFAYRAAVLNSDISCTMTATTITLTNCLKQEYKSGNGDIISFSIKHIRLPLYTRPIGNITTEIYSYVDDNYFIIDKSTDQSLFQATVREMSGANVTSTNYNTNNQSRYTLSFNVSTIIPVGAMIQVKLPNEVYWVDEGTICENLSSQFSQKANCSVSLSDWSIYIENGFENDYKGQLSFDINALQNPRSVGPTGYFKFYTFDSKMDLIEKSELSAFLNINSSHPLHDSMVGFQPGYGVVGELEEYRFLFSTGTLLKNGDIVEVEIPESIDSHISATVTSCGGILQLSEILKCYTKGQKVYVTLNSEERYDKFDVFVFWIRKMRAPDSTMPSEMIKMRIYDKDFRLMNIPKNNERMRAVAQKPGILKRAILNQTSQIPRNETSLEFTIELAHKLPINSTLRIDWPKQLGYNESSFGAIISTVGQCQKMKSANQNNVSCIIEPYFYEKFLYIRQINKKPLQAGSIINFSIYGLLNSDFAEETDSFQVTTLTYEGYSVDQQKEDMTIISQCNWPCQTCDDKNKSSCTSCVDTSDFDILNNNTCLSSCPPGFYEANKRCYFCDDNCKTCGSQGYECKSCHSGTYLLGTTCVNQCPYDHLQVFSQASCYKCLSPCQTCAGDTFKCASCLQTVEEKYFYQGKCRSSCPSQSTIHGDGICLDCEKNCKTCEFKTDHCTSCNLPLKMNPIKNNCVETCPSDITVDMGLFCQECHETCRTCSKTSTNCTSCKHGLVFFENSCLTSCPQGFVEKNGICVPCAAGCNICQSIPEYCVQCNSSMFFFEFACVEQCPSQYKIKEPNICIPERFPCRFGYEYNSTGQCDLQAVVCKEGFTPNADLEKCLPVAGLQIPFLFLGLGLLWTIFVMFLAKRQRITKVLFGLTVIQQCSYYLLLYLSFYMDYKPLYILNMIAVGTQYFANIAFVLYFNLKSMKYDSAFKHWCNYHRPPTRLIMGLSTLFSFKFSRLFYSDFEQNTNAAFDTKFRTIIRTIFMFSMVSFMLLSVPFILTDIFTLRYIHWEYEIFSAAFDNLVLAVVIFILEIIEFKNNRKTQQQVMMPTFMKLQHESQLMVKSAIAETDQSFLLKINNDTRSEKSRKNGMLALKNSAEKDEILLLESLIQKLEQNQRFIKKARSEYSCAQTKKGRKEAVKVEKKKFTFVIRDLRKRKKPLEILNERNYQEEMQDKDEFNRYLEIFKNEFERKKVHRTRSFDDEFMRDEYDDKDPSQNGESVLSYPLRRYDHRIDINDPREQANIELFREKLKCKFHFNNCLSNAVHLTNKNNDFQPCQQHQFVGDDERDPFDSSIEFSSYYSDVGSDDNYFYVKNLIDEVIFNGQSEDSEIFLKKESRKRDLKKLRKSKEIIEKRLNKPAALQRYRNREESKQRIGDLYLLSPHDQIQEDEVLIHEKNLIENEIDQLKELSRGLPSSESKHISQSTDAHGETESSRALSIVRQPKKKQMRRLDRLEIAYGKKNKKRQERLLADSSQIFTKKSNQEKQIPMPGTMSRESSIIDNSSFNGSSYMKIRQLTPEPVLISQTSRHDMSFYVQQQLDEIFWNRQTKKYNFDQKEQDSKSHSDSIIEMEEPTKEIEEKKDILFEAIKEQELDILGVEKKIVNKFNKFEYMIYDQVIKEKDKIIDKRVNERMLDEESKRIQSPRPFRAPIPVEKNKKMSLIKKSKKKEEPPPQYKIENIIRTYGKQFYPTPIRTQEVQSERSASIIRGRRPMNNALVSNALISLKKHNYVGQSPRTFSEGETSSVAGQNPLKNGRLGLRRSGSEESDNQGSLWSEMKIALTQMQKAREEARRFK